MKHLRKLLLSAVALILSLSAHAQTKIYGNVIYSDNNATPMGIYSFNAEDGLTFEAVKVDPEMNASNGGVYENGKYHFVNMFTYYEYNAETWAQVKKENLGFMKGGPMQATALAYDETTGNVYGCFMDYTTYSYVFGTVDYDKAERTAIKSLGDNIMRCMVCTPEGKVYGINGSGTLYLFDKSTGETTEVGSTGLSISNIQGAICDPKDGTVYWAACLSNGKTGLYTLDVETASTMLVAEFPNNEEVTGLYILPTANNDGTPKAVTNLKSNFDNGSLTGTFSFTMPTLSNLDEPLTSATDFKVTVDGNVAISGSAQPGTDVVTAEVTLSRGHHNVSVTCSNPSGESLATYDFPYVGKDTPAAVENLKCVASDGKARLSWNAVNKGVNGGYIGNVTYDVVRYPGKVNVANGISENSFEESVGTTDFTRVYYTVTPCNDGEEYGDTVACAPVTFGSVINPPYSETFSTPTSLDGYTVIDADADGKKWSYEEYGKVTELYSNTGSSDDWLVTPGIKLSKDRLYKIQYTLSNHSVAVPQNYTIALLSGADGVDSPLKVITSGTVMNDTKDITEFVNVDADGTYYLALHTATVASPCYLVIRKLSVDGGTLLTAPGHVTDLTATAAENGELKVGVSFTTPTKTLDGKDITSLSKIELYRNEELIKTFGNFPDYTDFGKGVNMRYTDTQAKQGNNIYSVVAYDGENRGAETYTEAWAGLDVPQKPVDVEAKVVDGGIRVSWAAQPTGVHGGYVDTSALRYYVEDNNQYAIAKGIAETTVTDKVETDKEQSLMAYAVIAYNAAGQSDAGISNSLIIGAPYALPLSESFSSAQTHYFWGITGSQQAYFALDGDNSSDLDNGCVAFTGTLGKAELYSGKLNLKGNEAVKLTFDYYATMPQDAILEVKAYSPKRGYKTLGTINLSKWNSYRWLNAEYRLDEFIDDDDVQVYFIGTSNGAEQKFYIDRVKLEATSATGVRTVKDLTPTSGKIYDIQGRMLDSAKCGQLYISNGKKLIAK